jgi:ATP-binding cassette subfamily B protein RaxB
MSLLHFGSAGQLPVITQNEAAECGLACLAMVASYHGHRVDLSTLRRRHPISLKGVTLRGMIQVATNLQFSCRALRFELRQIASMRLPVIAHWDMSHFVVVKTVTKRAIVVHDPASGEKRYSLQEASKHLTGVALELTPTQEFQKRDERARLSLGQFWGSARGSAHAILQILVLSALLEIFVLASPFYMQITIDEVIAKGDRDLLLVLAIGFGLLTAASMATTALRSFIITTVQNTLHFETGARLFRHLLRLPITFFEKRHIGDILSRFTSIEPIRNILSEGLVAALIDGMMAALTLAMMFIYSRVLAVIAVAAFLAYAALRLVLFRYFRTLSETVIQKKALEASTFIESVRAIQSVKIFNRESEREGQWLNRYADTVNANVRLARAKIHFKLINDAIFGLENIVTVYLAASLALENAITVGMIFAFMSYKNQFVDKSVLLIEKMLEYKLLDLHLERLADIALTPIEAGQNRPISYTRPIEGRIMLRNVSFRYADSEPFVLDNINLTIAPGEFVTIMGPSGGGKTTLIKLMLGLLDPTDGEVLIDGHPLATIGQRAYREQIGAVMQEDQLLSGSIADNICFFDTSFDEELMIRCTQLAGIHDEIMKMPMTYNSLIGDMGSSLSGGQKQRVLLARALYRRPHILFLDEGTAHLDVDNERLINRSLKSLRITRVSVAHRPEISSGADRLLLVDRGGVLEGTRERSEARLGSTSASVGGSPNDSQTSPSGQAARL